MGGVLCGEGEGQVDCFGCENCDGAVAVVPMETPGTSCNMEAIQQQQMLINMQKQVLKEKEKELKTMNAAQRDAYERDVALLKEKENKLIQANENVTQKYTDGEMKTEDAIARKQRVRQQAMQLEQQKMMRARAMQAQMMQQQYMQAQMMQYRQMVAMQQQALYGQMFC